MTSSLNRYIRNLVFAFLTLIFLFYVHCFACTYVCVRVGNEPGSSTIAASAVNL